MRRRWPVLAATIPLVIGWTLVAAYPAAASSGPFGPGGLVQPGGPVSHLTVPSGKVAPVTSANGTQSTQAKQTTVTSSNWAGYAAAGANDSFTSVSANWTEPAGTCSSGDQYSAFWVGLDGYSSNTVEQIGTELDCNGTTPAYYAWWEMYPNAEVNFPETVKAGDSISASVVYKDSEFVLTLTDNTQKWTQTESETLAGADRSSAEIIAEAPCCTSLGGILPLTNFGTASFTSAAVNNSPLCSTDPVEVTMPDTTVTALGSATNDTCDAFNISYSTGTSSRTKTPKAPSTPKASSTAKTPSTPSTPELPGAPMWLMTWGTGF